MSIRVPSQRELTLPTLEALRALGGHATRAQVTDKVIADLHLQPVRQALAESEPGRKKTRLEERVSWCLSRLKSFGAVDNPIKGLWDLTEVGWKVSADEVPALIRGRHSEYRKQRREKRASIKSDGERLLGEDRLKKIEEWIEWSQGEIAALTSRIADLERERAR